MTSGQLLSASLMPAHLSACICKVAIGVAENSPKNRCTVV